MRRLAASSFALLLLCSSVAILPAAPATGASSQTQKIYTTPTHAESVTYSDGQHEVSLLLALDEVRLTPTSGKSADEALKAAESAGLKVVSTKSLGDGGQLVRVEPFADLKTMCDTLNGIKGAGSFDAVLYTNADSREARTAPRMIGAHLSVQGDQGTDVAAIAAKYGLTVVEKVPYGENMYILEDAAGGFLSGLDKANEIRAKESGVLSASPIVTAQRQKRLVPNDPLFSSQWNLNNTGTLEGAVAGYDLVMTRAWDLGTGAGVNIAITDDGIQSNHPDLTLNVRTALGRDLVGNDSDPSPGTGDDHGTACAGLAAAKGNNGIGVAGVAFDAGLVGVRLLGSNQSDSTEATAMNHQVAPANPTDRVHVNSNSWGPVDGSEWFTGPGSLAATALNNGITNGRGGLGTIYVWAGGNGREAFDDANVDGYANSRFTIAVGASGVGGEVAYYSESGACILVNSPSSNTVGVTTTDRTGAVGYSSGDYTNDFGGTSAAAPQIAGVCALMLQANPALGWRDVQHILVQSAVPNNFTNSIVNGAGLRFHHDFGFGRVNTYRAVALSKIWNNVPAASTLVASLPSSRAIADLTTVNVDLPISGAADFKTEHVELVVSITHTYRSDLTITLRSPSGTVSTLMPRIGEGSASNISWTFMSVAHWGENPNGTWRASVTDNATGDTGTINTMSLRVRGYSAGSHVIATLPNSPPGAPVAAPSLSIQVPNLPVDPEGDLVLFRYDWSNAARGINVTHGPTLASTDTLFNNREGVSFQAGDLWTVRVVSVDHLGAVSGFSQTARYRIEGDGTIVFEGWILN